jgi:predicted transcriptional regulator
MSGGVTVGKFLQSRPETLGLDLEILAGTPCILITGGLRVFGEVIFEAERSNLPVLRTLVPTPVAVAKVTAIGIASTRSSKRIELVVQLEHQLQLAGLEDIDESEIDDLPDTGDDR